MKSLYEDVGARIKKARISVGFTRDELAESANISTKFLYEIEKYKTETI